MKQLILISLMLVLAACAGAKPGAPGTNGLVGSTGPQGPVGQPGQSIQGPAGADGTVITPIKFCAEAPVYPSTFPEYGLCISGQIYAVYSANDGFLAVLPDGAYNSNAVGSTCNFVVTGCTVTH